MGEFRRGAGKTAAPGPAGWPRADRNHARQRVV